jgi:hypothetical protein
MSNAGGMATIQRYTDMLAGNTTWNPWEPDGAFDALSTVTVPSGGAASITFAGIPNTYKHLQIRGMIGSTSSFGTLRFNGDTTTTNYRSHYLGGDGASPFAGTFANNAYYPVTAVTGAYSGILDVLDYQDKIQDYPNILFL